MKKLLATTAAVFLVASGSAAVAGNVVPAPADPVISAPAPVVADDWSGFYFGGTAGWGTGKTVTVDNFDGLLYGGFAGYTYQFDNNMVLGVEVAASTGQREYDLGGTFDTTFIDLKARAGFAVDRALVYVSGGYSLATYDDVAGSEGGGFNVGAGVDFLVSDNVFVGAEYIYRDIDDTVNDPSTWTDQFGTIQARVGITF